MLEDRDPSSERTSAPVGWAGLLPREVGGACLEVGGAGAQSVGQSCMGVGGAYVSSQFKSVKPIFVVLPPHGRL